MEIHQLEYILAVEKYNNFTRAAEEIKVTQSALSQQINKLESELGVCLFVRTTRSVQLTPAGREFISYARRILAGLTQARQCVQEYAAFKKGQLTLGALPVLGHYNIPNLLSSFQFKFPGIKMNILEGQCEELLNLLHSSKIDAAFVQITKPNHKFRLYKLLSDRIVLVTDQHHPLANRLSVDLKELKNEKFILTPATSGHHQDFYNACLAEGFIPEIALKCSVVKTMLGFVREGIGITVLSSAVAAAEYDAGLKIIPITPSIHREIALAARNSDDMPLPLKLFLDFTSQWLNIQNAVNTSMLQ